MKRPGGEPFSKQLFLSSARGTVRMTVLGLCLLSFCVSSCDRPVHDFDSQKIELTPRPGVTVLASVKTITDESEVIPGVTFLHFDYALKNGSSSPILFSAAEVRLSIEGVASMDSWYDSQLDTVRHGMRRWDTIKVGERRTYELFTAFANPLVLGSSPSVVIIVPGIR